MWSINFSTKTGRRQLGTSLQIFPGGVSFIHCNTSFEVIVGPPPRSLLHSYSLSAECLPFCCLVLSLGA